MIGGGDCDMWFGDWDGGNHVEFFVPKLEVGEEALCDEEGSDVVGWGTIGDEDGVKDIVGEVSFGIDGGGEGEYEGKSGSCGIGGEACDGGIIYCCGSRERLVGVVVVKHRDRAHPTTLHARS
jgi:hypothetical protein